jgi:MYXO-CTERM domain-containing protein
MTDADLQRDIESTRQALGDTVEALAHKADVKTRVERKVDDVRARATRQADRLQTPPGRYVVLAALAALVVVGFLRRRRR